MLFFPRGDAALSVIPTTSRDRQGLERMIDGARWRHLHLDWYDPLLVIDETPFLKITRGSTILGCLGCPPEIPGRAWIRVLAVSRGLDLQTSWDQLWSATTRAAKQASLQTIDILLSARWMAPLLSDAGFQRSDEVVFFEQQASFPPPSPPASGIIRPMTADDVPAVLRLDGSAFDVPWRMSPRSLRAALKTAAYASLYELEGEIVGYQVTSHSPYSAHLSRLAVAAEHARCGLGTALTLDAVRALAPRAPERWTVNTQASNQPAQALYRQLGFRETGVHYPMHTIHL